MTIGRRGEKEGYNKKKFRLESLYLILESTKGELNNLIEIFIKIPSFIQNDSA